MKNLVSHVPSFQLLLNHLHFQSIFSSLLWNNFFWITPYPCIKSVLFCFMTSSLPVSHHCLTSVRWSGYWIRKRIRNDPFYPPNNHYNLQDPLFRRIPSRECSATRWFLQRGGNPLLGCLLFARSSRAATGWRGRHLLFPLHLSRHATWMSLQTR